MEHSTQALKPPPVADGQTPFFNHLFKFKSDTHGFLQEQSKNMGPLFTVKLLSRDIYVLNHPDAIQHVLAGNAHNYSRMKPYSIMVELLGRGLITTEGDEWKRRRRIAQPSFHKRKMGELFDEMQQTITQFIEQREYTGTQSTDLDREMSQITIEVLSNTILKNDIEFETEQLKTNFALAWDYLSQKRFRWTKLLNKLPSKTKSKGQRAIADLKKSILEIIEKRRTSSREFNDLMDMLMNATDEETGDHLSNEELLDEVITLFTAGHDTTAVALTWSLYCLAHHPKVEEKVLAEIDRNWKEDGFLFEDLRHFPYLNMFIREVMRLFPPVWTFGRRSLEEDEIMGFKIPADASVTLPSILVHRNPEFWEKPDDFYPEHFTEERVAGRHKYAYFPFGGGQRLCIGQHFALMEIQLVLMFLLRKYTVTLASNKPAELNLLISTKPKNPIWAVFTPRNI